MDGRITGREFAGVVEDFIEDFHEGALICFEGGRGQELDGIGGASVFLQGFFDLHVCEDVGIGEGGLLEFFAGFRVVSCDLNLDVVEIILYEAVELLGGKVDVVCPIGDLFGAEGWGFQLEHL